MCRLTEATTTTFEPGEPPPMPVMNSSFDTITDYPYILLYLEELGGRYEGTNDEVSRAFCQIPVEVTSSAPGISPDFFYYTPTESNRVIKLFNPRISIDS